jgi:ADP-ribose pyrophosphatase
LSAATARAGFTASWKKTIARSSFRSKARRFTSSNSFVTPSQERALELPQGGWETADVDPEELARGELREETGLAAAKMTFLGTLWVAYGFLRQKMHVFVATGLTEAGTDRDAEEHDLVLRTASIAEFEQMLLDGTIRDSCTVAA